jgi:hypothetical protein
MILIPENHGLPQIYANEEKQPKDIKVPIKLFNPVGNGRWFITEYDPETKEAFGFVDLDIGPECAELGYISITELEAYVGPLCMKIERDIHWNPETTLQEVLDGKRF